MISKAELRGFGWSEELIEAALAIAAHVAAGAMPLHGLGNGLQVPAQVTGTTTLNLSHSTPTGKNSLIIGDRATARRDQSVNRFD